MWKATIPVLMGHIKGRSGHIPKEWQATHNQEDGEFPKGAVSLCQIYPSPHIPFQEDMSDK